MLARLRDGKGRSTQSGACRYRGDNGNQCVIGCLIDDENYNPRMEGVPLGKLSVEHGVWTLRDDPFNTVTDERRLIELAKALNLQGIPATPEMMNVLSLWQVRHDTPGNWKGNRYVGDTSSAISH